ncbi:PAS domain S-box protein, partial [Cryobacterium sp. MLB-32]|uniref:PAS domain S-box protein n=1 Tax=Cryobacterium sp. MLB-32 TaxID=1529318 RepID=UPI0018CEAC93
MASRTGKFGSLFEPVPYALAGMDRAGVIWFVNHQAETLFGYDRGDLVGRPIQMLLPEYLPEDRGDLPNETIADPKSRPMVRGLSGRKHDGSEVPVSISLSALDTGDVLMMI